MCARNRSWRSASSCIACMWKCVQGCGSWTNVDGSMLESLPLAQGQVCVGVSAREKASSEYGLSCGSDETR